MAHAVIEKGFGALGRNTATHLILPDGEVQPKKVLYLLHGLSDDASVWTRMTALEQYARQAQDLMIVMPDGGRSFYADTVYGENYFTFLSEELPAWINQMFRTSAKAEDTYIAGLSMGGYGALKTALIHPDRFGGVAAFSAVCDVKRHFEDGSLPVRNAFGDDPDWDALDLFALLQKADSAERKPKIYQWCGTSDFLYQDNKRLQEAMEKSSFDYHFFESEGDHIWACWNEQIRKALEFFSLI